MVQEYGYEYDAVLDETLYERCKGKVTHEEFRGALCVRSGRDAIKVVAREFLPTVALLPALACDSMVLPFEMYGHEVNYYKLNSDYSVDIDSLCSFITNNEKKVLFLYMDYFGNKAIKDSDLENLKETYPSLIFIEDRTHNLLVETTYSFKPDYTVASLRKWLDVPDGGLVWTDKILKNNDFGESLIFSNTRLKAQCQRHEFLLCGDEKIKKQYRKVFSTVTDIIDEDQLPGLMSEYSYQLAKRSDFAEINCKRMNNAQTLINELQGFEFVQNESGYGDVYVAVLINNRDDVQRKLASMGIFCTIIWPLNEEQRKASKVAKHTEEHMLTIYCDQRYTEKDMKYVASCIRGVCNE